MKPPKLKCIIHKITNNHLAKLGLGAPRRNAKHQLGLWMGCSLLHEENLMSNKPRVEIEFCTQCRWLLRAAWLAQELLTTFETEIGEVALIPGTGGIFEVRCGGQVLWSRKQEGRFPEAKELKQRVRDQIAPDKPLGHSDSR